MTNISAEILHSEKSLYRNIMIEEKSGKRCMVFGRLSKSPDYQSCINPDDPDYLVFSYTKLVMAGISLIKEPKSILIIGLGGGTLPTSLENNFNTATIDTVEIDEAVVRVAKKWFFYQQSNKQKVITIDGRVFVKRQLRKQKNYDLIILDAFNGDYIPEHLMTKEFLKEIKQLLSDDGLLIANTFSNKKLYDHESVTYQNVFGDFNYIHSKKSGNRIIYAFKSNLNAIKPSLSKELRESLSNIGVNFYDFERRLTKKPDWQQDVRPLTDQYSPANLLNQ
ncbi:MAG: spermidine synthase [Gammaproteobacteria bacterium]|nr:spermidine synthase [Gammaproteobacteria bacterium]